MSAATTPIGVAYARLAAAAPDAPAITFEGRTVSRDWLERHTNRLARAYRGLGVVPDSLVTIALPNGIEFLAATIATWKAGATPQPVSFLLPARERDALLELASPSLAIGLDASVTACPAVPEGFEPGPQLSDAPLEALAASSWKAPTSGGSTGQPKLIVDARPAVVESIVRIAQLCMLETGDVVLMTGPLYHNAPFITASAALMLGCHVYVMRRFDAGAALELIGDERISWMYAVPTMMHRIWHLPDAQREAADVSSLRVLFHLSAPCPPWLKRAWIDWIGPDAVWEMYGGTEAQAVTIVGGREWLEHEGSVGRAAFGEIKILGADGAELPPGEVGEVWMHPPGDGASTYHYVGSTPRRRDGWESVGDRGRLDADGYLYLADRKADMILVGGANVYPAEVEAAIDEHPAVDSSCVIGLPDEDLGNVIHAIVQMREPIGDDELLAFLADRLVPYKRPRSIERVQAPLRDDAGKVRRSALRAERLAGRPVR